jgi:hypothetical protein
MIVGMVFAGIAAVALIIGMILVFTIPGGFFIGFLAAIPLAIAGILSLIGLIITGRYTKKGAHPLGKAAFIFNLIVQILAIIFTILMFMPI